MICDSLARNGYPCDKEKGHGHPCSNTVCACGRGPKASSATVCRECAKVHASNSYRRHREENPGFRYGISIDEYRFLLKSQEGKCALCDSLLDTRMHGSHHQRIHVDHAHEGNLVLKARRETVRGLLCPLCNRLLGYIERAVKMGWVVRSEKLEKYLSHRPIPEMGRTKKT